MADFRRGDADEVLNSIANFNIVLKACDLEDIVAYLETVGSAEEETDLGTLVWASALGVQGLRGRCVDASRIW